MFVSGLPESVTETEIETFFGSIGVIKVIKLCCWLKYIVLKILINFP